MKNKINIGRCLNFVTGFKNAVTKGTNSHKWAIQIVRKTTISVDSDV